jgi:hypothetical protein
MQGDPNEVRALEIVSIQTDNNDEPRWSFAVGADLVTKIVHEVENYGDHGIAWFHVHRADGLWRSLAAKAVANVIWDRRSPTEGDGNG